MEDLEEVTVVVVSGDERGAVVRRAKEAVRVGAEGGGGWRG